MARDTYKYFRIEASDIIDRLTQGLIRMRDGSNPPGGVRELLRLAHTLKGAASVVDESKIASEAHALESLLSAHSAEEALSSEFVAELLVAVERLAQSVTSSIRPKPPVIPQQPEQYESESVPTDVSWQSLAPSAARGEEVLRTVRVDVDEMDQVVHGVTASMVRLAGVQNARDAVDRAAALSNALTMQAATDSGGQDTVQRQRRISGLAEKLASTLAMAQRELAGSTDQLERELTALQESTSHLRLTPVYGLFIPMERAAVSAAQQLGKEVRFVARGGEMRIDAQLLAAIRDPLLHVVRNAVAHGIELPVLRRKLGKPAEGTVSLSVERRGSQVSFICRDDGGGIELEKIRDAAVQRRFLTAEEALSSNEQQLLSLITRPGFTTQSRVSQIAGRGIGLDAVASVLEQLHGSLQVSSRAGEGTTIELTAPAALLVTEVVLAEVATQVVALPSDSIRQTLPVSAKDIVNEFGHEKVIADGSLLPYLSMSRALQIETQGTPRVAVILQVKDATAAIGVDRLRGTGTLVSRPLPPFVMAEPFVSGVALDPQGTPQLILDPAGLVAAAATYFAPLVAPAARALPILVIDDSLTTRMLEQSILEAAGFEVDIAVTAEQALEKAREREYGLFLVDVEMPGMNGFEFVELTRSDHELREIPAILVTSRSSAEDRARGRSAGASDYVIKSEFDQGYLLDRIKQLVRSA